MSILAFNEFIDLVIYYIDLYGKQLTTQCPSCDSQKTYSRCSHQAWEAFGQTDLLL
eukprot:TRINITY_DN12616_c0_g1_i1.p1 TRINITY_DN12616_c0_g1~~TRINITY_DN12616_c0_g1_i1.p1  ORF type:complete len:56 (-),score=2.15 TRINITY_DN12616_c0_g1_i1:130-297(-)